MNNQALFPISHNLILSGFTTSTLQIPNVQVIPLNDKSLGVHKVFNQTTHNVVKPPHPIESNLHDASGLGRGSLDDLLAWEAFYPKGSINPRNEHAPPGGFGFYLTGPKAFVEELKAITPLQEVLFSYQVMFEEGWEWVLGGKLPGIYGGVGDSAYGCTGGRQSERCNCFNLRLMWRQEGSGELYAYLPKIDTNTELLLRIPPKSIQHPDYGFSVGRGAWHFQPGTWTTMAQRVKINAPDQANGEIEVYIDGKSVILAEGLILRTADSPDYRVQGLHFQTFFGGHSPEWASPKDQRAWFTGISGAIFKSSQVAAVASAADAGPSVYHLSGEL